MKSYQGPLPNWASWAGPVALLVGVAAAGLWLWKTHPAYVPLWSGIGLLALMAALGMVWLYRVRAARRLFAALDAYATQELARAQPPTPSLSKRAFSGSPV